MYEYRCIINRIVDGDTVDIDIDLGFEIIIRDERIRLYGIDAPESRTSDPEEKIYGKLASAFVEKMLPIGSKQLLISHDFKGKFGRILGDFKIGELTLCNLLVSNFHAVPYYGQSKKDIAEEHLRNRKCLNLKTICKQSSIYQIQNMK
jgi:endonuclease YncB( thermonuclease family)